jgi:hypothetical protein
VVSPFRLSQEVRRVLLFSPNDVDFKDGRNTSLVSFTMASNHPDARQHRSGPPSPSPTPSITPSEHSVRSTSSACRVCWRQGCQLPTHRDYARRAALPPARPSAVSRQSSREHEPIFPVEMKANMRQLYQHCMATSCETVSPCTIADVFCHSFHGRSAPWRGHTTSDRRLEESSLVTEILFFIRDLSATLLQYYILRGFPHCQQSGWSG